VLKQGSIVLAQVSDPQGGNSKARPVVIVTPTNEINAQSSLVGVAITGAFSDPLADDEVAIPYHPAGTARTGLRKPCVAKCSWMVIVEPSAVLEQKGFLSTERLVTILTKIASLQTKSESGEE
jgi:mRNA-degrading endonuclease toxin of MazEF toxin-antitoxin module